MPADIWQVAATILDALNGSLHELRLLLMRDALTCGLAPSKTAAGLGPGGWLNEGEIDQQLGVRDDMWRSSLFVPGFIYPFIRIPF